jgi:hypothetical protein
MWLLGVGFYLYPIFPCILVSLISYYLVMRVVEKPMSPTIVDAGGSPAVILFLKGAVRVQAIRMLLGIVPALIVLAILVHLWRQWRGVMTTHASARLCIRPGNYCLPPPGPLWQTDPPSPRRAR